MIAQRAIWRLQGESTSNRCNIENNKAEAVEHPILFSARSPRISCPSFHVTKGMDDGGKWIGLRGWQEIPSGLDHLANVS
jgi:hypothetical protein